MPVPPRILDRSTARNYLLTNLLVLPGLGTFLSGHRVSGVFQAVLALAGLGLTVLWFVTFCGEWWRARSLPVEGGTYLGWGAAGVGLFLVAWIWAWVTSRRLLRRCL